MNSYFLLDLGTEKRNGYVVGGRLPESDPAYSSHLDIGYNRQDFSWRDESPHVHLHSEEYFIVLRGCLRFLVDVQTLSVGSGQLLGVRAQIPHQIIGGEAPIENFLIRVPGGGKDKETCVSARGITKNTTAGIIQIDLKQPHNDYLLGACLPETHAYYSPLLDFTCVWGVDPAQEWQHERLHFHQQREEYYILLKGWLDFELDGSKITVGAGQILGVRPGAVHKVVGGEGPVEVLFVRVPGGRGDKTVVASCSLR